METDDNLTGFLDVKQALLNYVKQFPTKQAAAADLGVSRVFLWRISEGTKPISDHILNKIGFTKRLVKYYKYERSS